MRLPLWALATAALCLAGCPPPDGGVPPRVAAVDRINVLADPNAQNFDEAPGLDGVKLRVFLYQAGRGSSVRADGPMEFCLYEGRPGSGGLEGMMLFHKWVLSAEDLERFLGQMLGQYGYGLRLEWGPTPPRSEMLTLIVRYLPRTGPPVVASPVIIMVGAG